MAPLSQLETPARVRDLRAAAKRRAWSDHVKGFFPSPTKFRQLYDPTVGDTPADALSVPVVWAAAPASLRRFTGSDDERWKLADSDRSFQDEYCEWAVERNAAGKLTRVTFTTEVPEYFGFLAEHARERLLDVYEACLGRRPPERDLFRSGAYREINPWNPAKPAKGRIVHLTQDANRLAAAVGLAALATVPRERDGEPVTGKQALVVCADLGSPFRNSDPQIASVINGATRAGASITLEDPIGLYIDRLATNDMRAPDGTNPARFWKVERGKGGHVVRASFSVPNGKGYTVSDVRIAGRPIRFGAQLAERVHVRLTAVVRPGTARPRPQPCAGA